MEESGERTRRNTATGENTLNWQARVFGGVAFPIPIKKFVVIAPTLEIDQEPEKIKYVSAATATAKLT
jgi:hypothetical protein